jgi:predicted nucleic-acid-binding protein
LIGLDTNVLVRYLTQDHPQQSKIATELIEGLEAKEEPCFISAITLCELVWVLESCYSESRSRVADLLEQLLKIRIFVFEDKKSIHQAIGNYRESKGDFADYLIAAQAKKQGAEPVYTFDKELKNSEDFKIL